MDSSKKYENSLRKNKNKIVEFIGYTSLVYDLLEPDDREQIRNTRHQIGRKESISNFIDILLKYNDPEKFTRLYEIAKESSLLLLQLTLDDEFTEEMWIQWKKDRKALLKYSYYIVRNMGREDMEDIVDFLVSEDALTLDDEDRIKNQSTKGLTEQNWELIEILPSRAPNWFELILKWLKTKKNYEIMVASLEKERNKVDDDFRDSPQAKVDSSKPSQTPTRWKKGTLIGHGLFGAAYKCLDQKSGRELVVKITHQGDTAKAELSKKAFRNEIHLYSEITNHPRLVQYFGFEENASTFELYIFFEYMIGGSLHTLLCEYGPMCEEIVRRYTAQIVQGLAYLHRQRIIHRNIKVTNIFRDVDGKVKLGDFGITKRLSGNESRCYSFIGESPRYMAPEMILSESYSFPVDIWALGWTIVEMFTGKPPYDGETSDLSLLLRISQGQTAEYTLPEEVSKTATDFMELTLKPTPDERPTAADLLAHDFVRNVLDN